MHVKITREMALVIIGALSVAHSEGITGIFDADFVVADVEKELIELLRPLCPDAIDESADWIPLWRQNADARL